MLNKFKIKKIKKRNLYKKQKLKINLKMIRLVICPEKEDLVQNNLELSEETQQLGLQLITEIIQPHKEMITQEKMEQAHFNQMTS